MNTLKCPNCNALLSHPADAKTKKCEFCGFEIYVKPKTVTQPRTIQQAPAAHASTGSGAGASVGCFIFVIALLAMGGGFLTYAFSTGLFDTSLPASTQINETITLEDRNETISGVAINAGGVNTKVFIRNCNIKAEKLLVARQPNVEIEIVNSRIETTDNTFEFQLNPKIHISKNSVIISTQGTVFKGGQNVELSLTDSRIIGKKYAVDMGNNGNFVLEGKSLIRGGKGAIRGEHNIHVEMQEGSTVESDETALELEYNGRLKMEKAVLRGKVGVEADANFELTMTSGKILGTDTGLTLATNAKVMMEGGTIAGAVALESDTNSMTVEMEGGEIIGAKVGISAKQTLKLEMEGGKIRGQTAVQAMGEFGTNDITIEGGAVEGVKIGIEVEKRANLTLTGGSIIGETAIRVAEYSDIKISGTAVRGFKVGILGGDRLNITGDKGSITGAEYAVVMGQYSSLPNDTVIIKGEIKDGTKNRKRNK